MEKNIYQALSCAQAELKNAAFDKENKFQNYRYATISSVLDTVRPVLSKHGLSFTQVLEDKDGQTFLITYLHFGLDNIKSSFPLFFDRSNASKNPWHDRGAAITYARRYSLCALIGISGEEDTDAEGITESKALITLPQVKELENLLKKLSQEDRTAFLIWANINGLNQLQEDKFKTCKDMLIKKIEKVSKGEENGF